MDLEAVMTYRRTVEQSYTVKETLLYGLGLSLGQDPMDPVQLKFVYEKDLEVLPSMCNILAHPGFWVRDPALQIDWVNALHGEQRFVVHDALPPAGTVVATTRVLGVRDKGAGRGALLYFERCIAEKASGRELCTVQSTGFLRGDGGCGSTGMHLPALCEVPEEPPNESMDWATTPQSALIYRLSGDLNPLHAEPAVAAMAGFDRPILHGLCTMGMACFALISLLGEGQAARFREMQVRFSGVFYPGETLRLECWRSSEILRFRARVVERGSVVLDCGSAVMDA